MIEFRDPRLALKAHGLWAKKHFGQNFLVAPDVPSRIAHSGRAGADDTVFEIGPGVGTLTRALADVSGRVVALERDRDLVPVVKAETEEFGNVEIREGDVLDVDWPALCDELKDERGQPPIIYGNLPYHLSTPIIVSLLEAHRSWRRCCFLLQKEFADRVAAKPGDKLCGSLSALAWMYAKPRRAFVVPAGAFHPKPKVTSAVLVMDAREAPPVDVGDERVFRTMVRALFNQRRKTARNALKQVCADPGLALEKAGLDARRRGETFTLEELGALSQAVVALREGA
ncbi:MAG: 16S rRNA (adenine(1518)-N(6)/adenine(1519)-N(6))-dimethyltransferase RsmA [Bradymonadia bacterium]